MNTENYLFGINILLIILPLSVIVTEYLRTRRIEELILFFSVILFGALEFFTRFVFSCSTDTLQYTIYRLGNGILFAIIYWILLFREKGKDPVFFTWLRVSIIVPVAAVFVFWVSWRHEALTGQSGQSFVLWQILTACCIGYPIYKIKKNDRAIMYVTMLFWIIGLSYEYFLTLFYAALSFLLFSRKIKNILEIDIFKKQLLREKETIFRLINDIGASVRDIRTNDETLKLILHSAIEATHADAGAIYIYTESSLSSNKVLRAQVIEGHFTPLHAGSASKNKGTFMDADMEHVDKELIQEREIKIGEGIIGSVANAGQAILIEDARSDPRIKQLGGSALNIHTLVAVPIKIKNDLLGVLICINKKDGKPFIKDDSSVLQTLGDQTALSVNNARLYSGLTEQERMQRELEIAKEIQLRLLPETIPIVNGINISTVMKTAREVGGDYYDCIKFDEERMGIVIGDVAGKGVPAGMIVLIVRTALHILAYQYNSARELISNLSARVFPQMESREFMTFLYLLWDSKNRTLRYSSAGHEHILHYQRNIGKVNRIRSGGVAIGMHPEIDQFLSEKEIKVKQGDFVVLYTDGITEARDKDGNMYGLDRLQRIVEKYPDKAPEEQKQIIFNDVEKFAGETEQYDDMTLIICKFV